MKKLNVALLLLTASGITAYWTIVALGLVEVRELVPGFLPWFFSFPAADFWIAATAVMGAFSLTRKSKQAPVWLSAAGSGLLFLALNAILFGHNTGLLYQRTVDEFIEILIKIYSLGTGSFLVWRGLVEVRGSEV